MSDFNEMIPENEKRSAKRFASNQLNINTLCVCIAVIVVVLALTIVVFRITDSSKENNTVLPEPTPQVSVTTIGTRISGASDLITAKMSYTGLVDSTDGSIPIINKKRFLMTYHATVSVGYDLSKAAISVDDSNVVITMPALSDPEINVDTDSISFFDLNSAIFNWTDKEDGFDAVNIAKNEILSSSELQDLDKQAQDQANTILRKFLEDSIGERHLDIKFS